MKAARTQFGFTLPELLTVLAILAVLSALLFPVFRAAKASAYRTACASSFHQVQVATYLYLADYDDRFMPVNYAPAEIGNPEVDKTWVQVLLPYISSFRPFLCPSDYGRRADSSFVVDDGVVSGDTYTRYYLASLRVNVGYNYLYYSPVMQTSAGWSVQTRTMSMISDPSRAMIFVDSVYDLTPSGSPTGGGSYVVIPPCRYQRVGGNIVDSFDLGFGTQVFAANKGWITAGQNSKFRYGLAWPWHDGRMNILRLAGGTAAVLPPQLASGCDVQPDWTGYISDRGQYYWDFQ